MSRNSYRQMKFPETSMRFVESKNLPVRRCVDVEIKNGILIIYLPLFSNDRRIFLLELGFYIANSDERNEKEDTRQCEGTIEDTETAINGPVGKFS